MTEESHMMLSDAEFIETVRATPLVAVDLIVQNRNSQILLGFRKNRPAKGCWFVPGGRIFKNETVPNAFVRIISTELGINIDFRNASLVGVFDHIYEDNFFNAAGVNTHYVVLAYTLVLPGEPVVMVDDQHSAVKWWNIDALLESPDVHDHTKLYFQK